MSKYQKIDTLFKRDEANIIIPSEFTIPEFEYLKNVKWRAEEKIDGTNIHIDLKYDVLNKEFIISYEGKTEDAKIPSNLLSKLKTILSDKIVLDCFKSSLDSLKNDNIEISIFGEGYGNKIQKGHHYIKNDVDFILFDVKIGRWWLKRENCEDIAKKLNIPIVPIIGYMTIPEAIEYVKNGFKSTISENKDFNAEGLVLKTPDGLLLRNGERIITKIKTRDFTRYKNKYGSL